MLCTCHEPPREIRVYDLTDKNSEWCHVDDETVAEVFHVHEQCSSRDCDGPHESSTTYQIPSLRWTADELSHKSPAEPDGHDLWTKLCRLSLPFSRPDVTIRTEGNDDGTLTVTWGGPTDEGFDSGALIGCKDPHCAHDGDTQRDVFAESMGY